MVARSQTQTGLNDSKCEAAKSLAQWMIANSFATGHGDTTDDLLSELAGHINELRAQLTSAHREIEQHKRTIEHLRYAMRKSPE